MYVRDNSPPLLSRAGQCVALWLARRMETWKGQVVNNTKEFWKSKTLWFNVLALVVALAAAFEFADFQPAAETEAIAGIIITLINLALRFKTNTGVSILSVE